MEAVRFSLLRGICQTPAYVAHARGYFRDEGLATQIEIEATAWLVPHKLATHQTHFAVMPWTRVAAAEVGDTPLVICCGSGIEEAAIVLRKGVARDAVKKVAVPREGGIKDLTAMGLLESLGWEKAELVRQPSGDGAILSLVGLGADAASMVEPYATMMEQLGLGTVIKRTGDIWPGAPGCSLATTWTLRNSDPQLVQAVVRAFVRGAEFVTAHPDETAAIAAHYIGVKTQFIREALRSNQPDVHAIRNQAAMESVLALMQKQGYVNKRPDRYADLTFLDQAAPAPAGA